MRLEIKVGKEYLLSYAIILTLSYASYATVCYSILGNAGWLRSLLILVVLGIDVAAIVRNNDTMKILLKMMGFFGALYGGTYLFCAPNRWVIEGLAQDAIKYTMLAYFLCVAKYETVIKALKASAYVILVCNCLEPFTRYVTGGENGYMVFGMRVLTSAILLGYFYFEERKLIHLCAFIVAVALILLFGNRSALMIATLSLVIQYVFFEKKNKRALHLIQIIVAGVLILLLVSSNVLNLVIAEMDKMGVSSRTLKILLSGSEAITDNTGRSIIWENCRVAIAKKPWTGYGIGGERNLFLLGSKYISRLGGVYAHNFIYEILLDFGVIIGSSVLLFLAWKTFHIVFSKKRVPVRRLFIVMILSIVIKLSFSGSVWNDMDAYVCLGIAMNFYRNEKLYIE